MRTSPDCYLLNPLNELSRWLAEATGTLVAGALLLLGASAYGQSGPRLDHVIDRQQLAFSLGLTPPHDILSNSTRIDTGKGQSVIVFDSSTIVDTSTVVIKQKSALEALLLSAVIPGGGQIYNRSYWKLPIIYGLQGFLVYEWISNNKTYQSFKKQYEDSLRTAGPPPWSYQEQYVLGVFQTDRDGARDQRDSYAWYIVGVYALTVLDAYIDAELSAFDVSPSLGFTPDGSTSAAILVRVKF